MITAAELFSKARRALNSSRLLLSEGDSDGACNRAYYAMFDAAKAALLASGFEEIALSTRTHSGLIAAFSLHLVKAGKLPIELGRSFNKVEDLRVMADYMECSVDERKSEWAVEQAAIFVEAIDKTFFL